MTETEARKPWEELARLAERGSPLELKTFLDELPASGVALAMSRLTADEQTHVVTILAPDQAADLVEQLSEVQAVELIEHLEPQDAAAILDELPSDDRSGNRFGTDPHDRYRHVWFLAGAGHCHDHVETTHEPLTTGMVIYENRIRC